MSGLGVDTWAITIGILCNASCALLGCYLVLRRLSLLGDAISHAVLPGIVVAFVLSQSRASVPMFAGAMAVGVLTAFLTQTVHRFAGVAEDTSMGVVFTSLFALGVVLVQVIPGVAGVDIDPACVFEGNIEFEAVFTVPVAGFEVPRTVPILAGVLLADLVFVFLLWKELKLAAFDGALCSSLGFSAGLLYYLLMAMVAGTTVSAFWAVGSILVVAMLIVPGATAQLLTDRLSVMMFLAVAVSVVAAVAGYLLADRWDTNAAGMMAVVAGGQYFLAMALAPRYGVLPRWSRNLLMSLRIACEDVLAVIYRWEERAAGCGAPVPRRRILELLRTAGDRWRVAAGLWMLRWRGEIAAAGDGVRLTPRGRAHAESLVRSHRLWESYLSEQVGLSSDHLHEPAMRMEHFVTPEIERQLLAGLGDAKVDPHGRPIPGGDDDEKETPEER